jgi:penicillin amidase
MSRNLRNLLLVLLSLLLITCTIVAALGTYSVLQSFPDLSGEIQLSGLQGPVDVYRDEFGIPQVYASNEHDLFFAQGYLHAQDRFWQMDFWRHIGAGRLSEMFGESQLDTDRFLRTLGWRRVAQQELDNLDATSLELLQSYSDGVNAYLADHSGSQLSLEYAVLGIINAEYAVEPWTPLDSMTWGKVMAWDLGGNLDSEIERAILLKTLSPEQVSEIAPPYSADMPVTVPGFTVGSADSAQETIGSLPGYLAASMPALHGLQRSLAEVHGFLGQLGNGLGSNNWALSGPLTSTGKPILANDPHLGAQMPSIWYEVGLHCVPRGEACNYDVTGFSFAGVPGVIIGHNDRVAWALTNVGPDVQDLYIEKVNPENPNQYEVNGQWVDMEVRQETLQVSDGEPIKLTVRATRHGPVISDTYLPEDFTDTAGIGLPDPYVVALRWTALEPSNPFPAIWRFDRAQNWKDFREGAREFSVPSQNLVYADVDGNIGYQMPGNIPIRASGDGTLPVPGWMDEYEWTGYIPFEELPFSFNPPEGYVLTANNAVTGTQYPYLISTDFDYGYRAKRITELLKQAPGPIDLAYIQKMQGDDKDLSAEFIVPLLMQLSLEDSGQEQARQLLVGWDYQASMDSSAAALYSVFWKHLLAATFQDDLPEDYWPGGGSRWFAVMEDLIQQPDSPWWDNKTTPGVENRDQIFAQAFSAALDELNKIQGNDPVKWNWGDLHTLTLTNQTLGESGIAPIEALFNRGPYRTSGGESIVNATGWQMTESYEVDWLPSMRMIVDLSNLNNSLAIHTSGQSGHAFHPNYTDMTDLWRTIQYHPMLWDRAQAEAVAKDQLKLLPENFNNE